jgi:hypothetical protein
MKGIRASLIMTYVSTRRNVAARQTPYEPVYLTTMKGTVHTKTASRTVTHWLQGKGKGVSTLRGQSST